MSVGAHLRVPSGAGRWRSVSVQSVRFAAGVALVAAVYLGVALGGEALLTTGVAGAFWPATGVGIAVLYLGGLRWWPGVLLGDLLSRQWEALPVGTALAESGGNLARAVVGAIILRQLVGRRAGMDRLVHVGAVLVAVATADVISATVAMFALEAGGKIDVSEMGVLWRTWWLGDVAGGVVVVPLALAWARPLAPAWRGRGAWEGALMIAAVAGLSAIALSGERAPLLYLVFPGYIWAALRFGPQGATLAVAVAAVTAAWATSRELGPFVDNSPTDNAVYLQLYVIFGALTTLCLAAIVCERRRAALELAESRARVAVAGARERRRLEAELHDSAQQRLVAMGIELTEVRERLDRSEDRAMLERLGVQVNNTMDDLRAVARGLHPAALTNRGVGAALSAVALHSAIPVEVRDEWLGRHSEAIETAVYFCCLECLQNTAKHAGRGACATIRLSENDGHVRFEVEDDGAGFDPDSVERGAGLSNLAERLAVVEGTLQIDARPGRGTHITGEIPDPS